MSDSDQNWNAGGDSPQSPEPASPWPHYDWAPAAPAAAEPAQPMPPVAATPPVAPTSGPGAYGDSGWGRPPTPPQPPAGGWGTPPGNTGPGGWAPAPTPGSTGPSQTGRRVLVGLSALALVLASAGIGAGIALAVHGNSKAQTFASAPTTPAPNNGSGNSGNGSDPFGGLNPFGGNGTDPFGGSGSGSGSGGSTSTGSGPLDANAIATKVDPAMVNIDTTLSGNGRAAGSGMIIGSSGEILTNNHVIADATSIKVTIGGVGQAHDAHVVGYDVADDVALVKVDGVSNLPTITFGDMSTVKVGNPVLALGNALGKGGLPKAAQGKVTALNQQVTAGDPGGPSETLHEMIQTDAPIQPGDSGGALIDKDGKVIGMNTTAAGGRFEIQSGSNIGFAIQIDNAIEIIHEIQSGNESNGVHIGAHTLFGVQVQDLNSQGTNMPNQIAPVNSGAVVTGVQGNTGATDAGLKAGDVITSVDGKSIADSSALHLALTVYHPGDSVKVVWVDANGATHDASVKLVEGPPA